MKNSRKKRREELLYDVLVKKHDRNFIRDMQISGDREWSLGASILNNLVVNVGKKKRKEEKEYGEPGKRIWREDG